MKFVARKDCWVPTARGWLVMAGSLLGAAALATGCLYDFLSVTAPVRADVLIVESWLSDKALRDAAAEFERGGYKYLMTCGPRELAEVWRSSSIYKTGPELAAAALTSMGLRKDLIVPLSPSSVLRDRTYSAALAAAAWLVSTNVGVRAVNVYSSGPHARRSRLLYQRALGNEVRVGVFAHLPSSYDPNGWWTTSNGFQDVIDEAVAYLYVRTLFRPPRPDQRTHRASVEPASSRLLAARR